MEPYSQLEKGFIREEETKASPSKKSYVQILAVSLLIISGVLSYAIFGKRENGDSGKAPAAAQRIIQLDVMNGCGAKGISAKFTNYLRTRGFDVVEMKNYKTFSVSHTLVIDRVGDLAAARHVADALGVPDEHVIQQINPDYFVDVSVVIGADYLSLRSAN